MSIWIGVVMGSVAAAIFFLGYAAGIAHMYIVTSRDRSGE